MNIYFKVDGGLGKHVMATAVAKAIKRKYPNSHLTVIAAYEDVFLHNPNVDEILGHDKVRGLYTKVKDQKFKAFVADPYQHHNFIPRDKHLIKIWCEMFDIPYRGEEPELFITQAEMDYYAPFYQQIDKPLLVIHPHGGPPNTGLAYTWTRDIPESTVMNIIEEFKNDYQVVQIKREDQKGYPDILNALDGFRSIAILLSLAQKRLLIDSSAQHLAKAMKVKSTVCWIGTSPSVFGYSINDNIKANSYTRTPDYRNSVFEGHQLVEGIETFPYNNITEVFNDDQIINSIKSQ